MEHLISCELSTPLGMMIVIADKKSMYFLDFIDSKTFGRHVNHVKCITKTQISSGTSPVIESIKSELMLYFEGALKEFNTPIITLGSDFQKRAWLSLMDIPYGETRSYLQQANALNNPRAYRAVANANGANHFAIVIPCHRIINANGKLGGYGSGTSRKKWLIDHEYRNLQV